MTGVLPEPDDYWQVVLRYLAGHAPELLPSFQDAQHAPLEEYIRRLWQPPEPPASAEGQRARRILNHWLRQHAAEFHPAAELCDFERAPVIQSAAHCQLAAEPLTFYTNMLHALGATLHGSRVIVSHSCSTNKLQARRHNGPGWFSFEDALVRVFEISGMRTRKCSVLWPQPDAVFCRREFVQAGYPELVALYERIADICEDSPEAAFIRANERLWQQWRGQDDPRAVFFGERVIARIVAEHVVGGGAVHALIFDDEVRTRFLEHLSRPDHALSQRLLPFTSELFWLMRKGEARRVVFRDGYIQEVEGPADSRVRAQPEEVAVALRELRLVPNLMLSYAAIGVVPRVKLLGGQRQIIYYPIIHAAVRHALEARGGDFTELLHDLDQGCRHGWILGLYNPPEHPLSVHCDKTTLLRTCMERARHAELAAVIGDFPVRREDPDWADEVGIARAP